MISIISWEEVTSQKHEYETWESEIKTILKLMSRKSIFLVIKTIIGEILQLMGQIE